MEAIVQKKYERLVKKATNILSHPSQKKEQKYSNRNYYRQDDKGPMSKK